MDLVTFVKVLKEHGSVENEKKVSGKCSWSSLDDSVQVGYFLFIYLFFGNHRSSKHVLSGNIFFFRNSGSW